MNFTSTLNLSYLEKMSAGDSKTQKMMLKMLLEELERDLPRLRRLCDTEDWDQVSRFCHHFKSTLVFSGNKTMLDANNRIWEHAKRQGKSSARIANSLRTLESQGKRVAAEVKRTLKSMS